ncbi:MAG: SGNH/GDSL hydrolase family protein [bacterium]|nr:SGNH/GDSL hydrolase family protein [bacterium]
MTGPIAPRDAEKERKSFYIMRNKETAGSRQPDGRGIQFIYLDNSRLVSFAKIAGGITDEELLGLLRTAEGFRRLVHSVGVTVETEDMEEQVTFALQMYGRRDTYHSGTTLCMPVKGDGMERILRLEEAEWSDDDAVPGQIRFEFPRADMQAKVAVRLLLQDGFDAPEPEEEGSVDFDCPEYGEMLKKSLMQTGCNLRLKRVIDRARRGEEVTVAFIGGSVTQGAGAIPINTQCYAWKTFERFCRLCGRGTEENIRYVKAGVGGTSSELGMVRYERDVCAGGAVSPDLVIVEYAVNDEGDETKGHCYDGLVRKILLSPQEPAVILLFAVFSYDWNLQESLSPVGYAYGLPMVSIKDCVVEQFYKKPGEGRVLTKNQFFYDIYHPGNYGHTVMADAIGYLLETVDRMPADQAEPQIDRIPAPYSAEFETVRLLDRGSIPETVQIDCGDFSETDKELQAVERDRNLYATPEFTDNWMHVSGGRPFVMEITCSALLIVAKDSGSPLAGCIDVSVDGRPVRTVDPKEVGWTHCSALILFRGEERRMRRVEVRMRDGDEEKPFTILGFGYV